MAGGDDPEDDLFAKAMQGVRPASKSSRVHRASPAPARPVAAAVKDIPTIPPASSQAPQAGETPWTLCASGVSRERLRRLADAAADRQIDLHGHTRDEALQALETAVMTALAQGERTLCIVHGRGLHSQGKAVLKQAVFQWLREGSCASHVLAAVPRAGSGGGASMVLFRRREKG